MHSFQAGYLGTVARISNFFLQAYRRTAYGRPIIVQLKKSKMFMLLLTPLSAVFGGHCCRQSLLWNQWLTSVGCVPRIAQQFFVRQTAPRQTSQLPSRTLRNTSTSSRSRGVSTSLPATLVERVWEPSLVLTENFNHPLFHQTPLQIQTITKCTTPLTMPNRCTIHLIPYSQDWFTFLLLESALCLE